MFLTILSLIVGYLTLSLSVALLYAAWPGEIILTHQFLAIASISSLGFATLSGYLTGLIAQRSPLAHTAALALLLVMMWGLYLFITQPAEPLLLSVLNLAIGVIGVITGGWLRKRQLQSR
ncbi:MAG: hypothetical protein WBD47_14490 [Phormidesmis sp.]